MKRELFSIGTFAALLVVATLVFSCGKKAETSTEAAQDTTAQAADTTAAEHPEHPAEHPADTTK